MTYACEVTENFFIAENAGFTKVEAIPFLQKALSNHFPESVPYHHLTQLIDHLKNSGLNTIWQGKHFKVSYLPTGGGGYYMWS